MKPVVRDIKTYSEVYLAARKTMREAGIESSDLDARLMAAKASGKTVAAFLRDARLYQVTRKHRRDNRAPTDVWKGTDRDLSTRCLLFQSFRHHR